MIGGKPALMATLDSRHMGFHCGLSTPEEAAQPVLDSLLDGPPGRYGKQLLAVQLPTLPTTRIYLMVLPQP